MYNLMRDVAIQVPICEQGPVFISIEKIIFVISLKSINV